MHILVLVYCPEWFRARGKTKLLYVFTKPENISGLTYHLDSVKVLDSSMVEGIATIISPRREYFTGGPRENSGVHAGFAL